MAYYKCGKIFATQNSNTSIETASGAIANFNTSLAMPVLDCIAEFSATQDLHGQSAPYPAGGGKNLIDLSSMVSGYVTTTGTFSSAHSMGEMRSNFIPVKPNTNYIFSIVETTGTADDWVGIGLYTDDDVSSFIERKKYWSFTTSADTRFIVVSARNLENATKIQLEEGSEATDYAPYSNICPIAPVSSVNVTRTGKNLLPSLSSAVTVNQITFSPLSDGAIDIDGTASGNASVDVGRNEGCFLQAGTYYVNITATPYTITVFGIVNGTVATIKSGGGLFTLTKPTQIFVRVFIASGTSVNHLRLPLQLERGSTATDYEAYNGTTVLINLGGTYYGGSVDAVTGKIENKCAVVTCIGSENENWSIVNQGDTNQRFRLNPAFSGYTEIASTHFSKISSNTGEWGHYRLANGYLVLTDNNNVIGSVANLKTWLANENTNGRPVQFVFELATPVTAQSSNTAELLTKAGLNNIYCDTGNIEVKYRRINNDL